MQAETEEQKCDICSTTCEERSYTSNNCYFIRCHRCGVFHITDDAIMELRRTYDKHLLSGLCRELSKSSRHRPTITAEHLLTLADRVPNDFDVSRKVRRLLTAIARQSEHAGAYVPVSSSVDISLAYARNIGEFIYLSQYAVDKKWISKRLIDRELTRAHLQNSNQPLRDWEYTLLPDGWEELQTRPRHESDTVFVAMSFDTSLTDVYMNGIRPAIGTDCHLKAIRVDMEEHNRDIVDKILGDLRESRFAVVDVTIPRQPVYFEAGFALGLGIPVIWTCRKSAFEDPRNRNLDTEHYNHILWDTPQQLRISLANRIRATIPLDERKHRHGLWR